MKLLNKLERRLGPYAVPHLTLALIICQVVMYFIAQVQMQGQPPTPAGQTGILEKAQLVPGPWLLKTLVAASILNFLLFFGRDIFDRIKTGRRHMVFQARVFAVSSPGEPFHRCMVCGITDQTHPGMEFRYCPQCKGTRGYCTAHIRNHDHIAAVAETVKG